jgi:putative MATE family efflux protein
VTEVPRTGDEPAGRLGARDLTHGPIGRTLILFALPMLGSTMLQSLNGSINSIWIGRFLGEDALAATANGNLLMFLLLTFVFGMAMASTVLIGQAFGRRDVAGARRILGTALGAFQIAVLVMALGGWIFAPRLLRLLATPEPAYDFALGYLRMILIALVPGMMMLMITQALRGAGDAMTPFWFMIMSVILDAALNPVFILGLGPAPQLGIVGSGVATLIANSVSLLALIVYIYGRDLPLRLRGAELRYLKPDGALLSKMVRMGIPMGLQMIVMSSSALVMLGLINRHGVLVTAAYSATQQLWTYIQMPAMALGGASSSMVAQNIGAGNWTRVSRITRAAVLFNILLTGSLVLLITIVDRAALGLFLGAHSPSLPIGEHIHLMATWGFVFFGITLVLFGTVRGNGTVVWPLIIMFVAMYPFRIGFALVMEPWLGTDSIWLSFPIGSLAAAAMATALYLHGGWRKQGPARARPAPEECIEEAMADGEPGGSLTPRA